MRRAVEDYDMIQNGDNIAVGCSGGKDSTLMLLALNKLAQFYPKKFTVTGITVDTGSGMDFTPLEKLCEDHGIPYIKKQTEIYNIIFNETKQKNPCSLCAKMRRGVLNETAKSFHCNKIALGHHNDDVLETFMLNLIHEGRLGCFQPVTYLSRTDVTVIRPMIYINEREIKSSVKRINIPIIKNPCPADGYTQRQDMKELLKNLDIDYKGLKIRMFGALQRSGIDGWEKANIIKFNDKGEYDE